MMALSDIGAIRAIAERAKLAAPVDTAEDVRAQRMAEWRRCVTHHGLTQAPSGPEWRYARLDNPGYRKRVSPELLEAVDSYDGNQRLFLSAPIDAGKTSLMLAWLIRQSQRGTLKSWAWVTGAELATARHSSEYGKAPPLEQLANRIPLLIMDDVGGNEAHTPVVYSILDHRFRRGLVTMLNTPLSQIEFSRKYGDASLKRILKDGRKVEVR